MNKQIPLLLLGIVSYSPFAQASPPPAVHGAVPIKKCWVRTSEEVANALGIPCKICIDTLTVTTVLGRTPKVVITSPQIGGTQELRVEEENGKLKATFDGFFAESRTICDRREGSYFVKTPGRYSKVTYGFDLSYEGEYLGNLKLDAKSVIAGYEGLRSNSDYSCAVGEIQQTTRRLVFWEADSGSNCPL